MDDAVGGSRLLSSRSRVRVAPRVATWENVHAGVGAALDEQLYWVTSQPGRLQWPGRASAAEPLDTDDEHEVIRRVDKERDESLMVLAEMQGAQ